MERNINGENLNSDFSCYDARSRLVVEVGMLLVNIFVILFFFTKMTIIIIRRGITFNFI